MTAETCSDLRVQLEKVFLRSLRLQEKQPKTKTRAHRKTASQSQAPSQVTFDDTLVECFATLSPKCKDEELEDLVFFILDLYQFHGVAVAIAEVDITQLVVDLRGVLEEQAVKQAKRRKQPAGYKGTTADPGGDEHIFLVLDKDVQGLPWESIPSLRGRSVSRIPNVDFLHDRIEWARLNREAGKMEGGASEEVSNGLTIDPRKGYFVLNPSGDLSRTEERFKEWAEGMKKVGWSGVVGHPPSEQQLLDALKNKDLVV